LAIKAAFKANITSLLYQVLTVQIKNMKTLVQNFLIISLISLSACETARYAYSPSAHNVPVLTQKGDGKIGGLYSTNPATDETYNNERIYSHSNGFDAQGAYALSDNWAIQSSYFQRWERTTGGPDSVNIKYKRNLAELGGGYYFNMNKRKTVFFQVLGGAGLGRFSFTDHSINGDYFHQSNIFKFYIQPAFVFRSKGSFSTSIALRASVVKFNSIKTNYSPGQLSDYILNNLDYRAKFFFEPAFVSSFGFKNVPGLRFEFQGSLSLLAAYDPFNYRPANFSVGSYLDFGSLKRAGNK